MQFATLLALIAAGGLVVKKAVDAIRNVVDSEGQLPSWTWNLVAFAVGIGYAVGFQQEILSAAAAMVPALTQHAARFTGIAGQVASGVIFAASSGAWHELLELWKAKRAAAKALVPTVLLDSQQIG